MVNWISNYNSEGKRLKKNSFLESAVVSLWVICLRGDLTGLQTIWLQRDFPAAECNYADVVRRNVCVEAITHFAFMLELNSGECETYGKLHSWSRQQQQQDCDRMWGWSKGWFAQKCNFCHYLLTLMFSQACITLFSQWNTERDILTNVQIALFIQWKWIAMNAGDP